MSEVLAPFPVFRAWNNLGFPLVGGKLFTYVAGTTTKQASYTDSTGGTPNANPVILNFRGEAQVWLDPTKVYKLVLAPATDTDPPTNPFWTVDNISGGAASPSFNIIPTVDNLYTLGNTSFSWANVYVGPNHAPILGASGIVGYYPRTSAEIALSVTPTDFSYPADPYIDPRRYGAKGDWNGTTGTDDTGAWQTALNVALAGHGLIRFPPNFTSLVGPLSITFNTPLQSLQIIGTSPSFCLFHAKAGLSATSLLTFKSTNPVQASVVGFLLLSNFGIDGSTITTGVHGLSLLSIACWQISNVRIAKFDRGIDLQGSLTGIIDQGTEVAVNNTGIRSILPPGAVIPLPTGNLIRIENARVYNNAQIGVDFNGGSELQMRGVDLEGNGQPSSTTTGALFIRGQLAPDSLVASILVDACWFEANGGVSINMDAQTGGCLTILAIRGGEILSADSGRAIIINGATKLSIEDLQCASAADTWNLKATDCFLKNCLVSTLTDTNVVFPTYINVSTSGGNQREGRVTTFTATLTNATGTPTGNVTAIQQGAAYRLVFPQITGASTATTDPSLSGLPSNLIPAASRAFGGQRAMDNSVELYATMVIASGTGTITLSKPSGTFTAAGNKGILTQSTGWIDL